MREYKQSTEEYKGFTLEIWRYCLNDETMVYHRNCRILKDGVGIGRGKTKKEAKDLIDHGCFQ